MKSNIQFTKAQKIQKIEDLVKAADRLEFTSTSSPSFAEWRRNVETTIEHLSPDDSSKLTAEFSIASSMSKLGRSIDRKKLSKNAEIKAFNNGIESVKALLRSIIYRIQEYEEDITLLSKGKKNQIKKEINMTKQKTTLIDVFISHSSKDEKLGEALVELIGFALSLPSGKIRCTSVSGYGLAGGADIDNQLRDEILGAKVFIGIITPNSIGSTYVVFELGARWGAKKYLVPLFVPSSNSTLNYGPLSKVNMLDMSNSDRMNQLVHELAKETSLPLNDPSVYQKYIKKLVQISKRISAESEVVQIEEEIVLNSDSLSLIKNKIEIEYVHDIIGEDITTSTSRLVSINWEDLFFSLASKLIDSASDHELWERVEKLAQEEFHSVIIVAHVIYSPDTSINEGITNDGFDRIKMELLLHKLIQKSNDHQLQQSPQDTYWTLTQQGILLLTYIRNKGTTAPKP